MQCNDYAETGNLTEEIVGYDVYGNKAAAPEGRYFRRNIRGWPPLADSCCELAPEETKPCKDWHVNEGFGLNAGQAVRLGCSRLPKSGIGD